MVPDASYVAGEGTPVLDGLGPIGGLDHGPDEYIELDSIVPRTALLAKVMQQVTLTTEMTQRMTQRMTQTLTSQQISSISQAVNPQRLMETAIALVEFPAHAQCRRSGRSAGRILPRRWLYRRAPRCRLARKRQRL